MFEKIQEYRYQWFGAHRYAGNGVFSIMHDQTETSNQFASVASAAAEAELKKMRELQNTVSPTSSPSTAAAAAAPSLRPSGRTFQELPKSADHVPGPLPYIPINNDADFLGSAPLPDNRKLQQHALADMEAMYPQVPREEEVAYRDAHQYEVEKIRTQQTYLSRMKIKLARDYPMDYVVTVLDFCKFPFFMLIGVYYVTVYFVDRALVKSREDIWKKPLFFSNRKSWDFKNGLPLPRVAAFRTRR